MPAYIRTGERVSIEYINSKIERDEGGRKRVEQRVQAEGFYDVEIDWAEVYKMAQRAARNRTKICRDGALRVKAHGLKITKSEPTETRL